MHKVFIEERKEVIYRLMTKDKKIKKGI